MSETSDPKSPSSKPPEDFRWGISYLREDIQDLRQDVNSGNQGLQAQIQDLRQDMNRSNQGLQVQIQDIRQDVGTLNGRIDETNRRIDSRFTVLITTMIGIGGLIVAAIKF